MSYIILDACIRELTMWLYI